MSHQHGPIRAGARHARPLLVTFVLVVIFLIVEVVAGILTNSLALLSDAGHMFTDAAGIGMALAAITAANRGDATRQRTFGLYRMEIVAALATRCCWSASLATSCWRQYSGLLIHRPC